MGSLCGNWLGRANSVAAAAHAPYDHGVRWFGMIAFVGGCAFHPPSNSGPDADAPADSAVPGDAAVPGDSALDAAIDAQLDAPPTAACPSDYAPIGALASHYRITASATAFRAGHDDCKDDLVGHTHLVVLDAPGEHAALREAFGDREWWIGAVQAPALVIPWGNWSHIVGGAAALPWKPGQPDDDGGVFGLEAGVANVAASVLGGVADRRAGTLQLAVCECDHRPVDAAIERNIPVAPQRVLPVQR